MKKFCGDFSEKLLSYPEIYFGPPGTIWALRNYILRKKSRKKSQTQLTPPGAGGGPNIRNPPTTLGKCPRDGPPHPPLSVRTPSMGSKNFLRRFRGPDGGRGGTVP